MARRAFVIGSNGSAAYGKLRYAKQDAEAIAECLGRRGCDFDVVRQEATTDPLQILRELIASVDACQEGDVFVCYFSGHGALYKSELFMILDESEPDSLFRTALAAADITKHLARCEAGNKLLILDCCHAGAAVPGGKRGLAPGPEASALGLDSKNHLTLLASGRLETAREFDDLQGSFLTREMCNILSSDEDRPVTAKELVDELRRRGRARNAHLQHKVPLPYLYGEYRGDLVLRTTLSTNVLVHFVDHVHPDTDTLSSTLWRYLRWTPEFLLTKLPVSVRLPSELQAYVDTVNEYIAADHWPGGTTPERRRALVKLTSTTLPLQSREIARAIGLVVSLTQREFAGDGCLTLGERDRLLDVYLQSKMLAMIRVMCSTHPENWSHEPWMEAYFRYAPEGEPVIASGLPAVITRPTSHFWTNAELVLGDTRCVVFLPSSLLVAAAELALTRAQVIDIVLPQIIDSLDAARVAPRLLTSPALARWAVLGTVPIRARTFEIAREVDRARATFRLLAGELAEEARAGSMAARDVEVLTGRVHGLREAIRPAASAPQNESKHVDTAIPADGRSEEESAAKPEAPAVARPKHAVPGPAITQSEAAVAKEVAPPAIPKVPTVPARDLGGWSRPQLLLAGVFAAGTAAAILALATGFPWKGQGLGTSDAGNDARVVARPSATPSVVSPSATAARPPNADEVACSNARQHETVPQWRAYLQTFPDGGCAPSARAWLSARPNEARLRIQALLREPRPTIGTDDVLVAFKDIFGTSVAPEDNVVVLKAAEAKAINTVIAQAAPSTVFLFEDTQYVLAAPLHVKGGNGLKFMGFEHTELLNKMGQAVVQVDGGSEHVSFYGLYMNHFGPRSHTETGMGGGCPQRPYSIEVVEMSDVFVVASSTDVSIVRCVLNGSGFIGVHGKHVSGLLVQDSSIYHCTSSGISLEDNSDVRVNDVFLYDVGNGHVGSTAYTEGIRVDPSSKLAMTRTSIVIPQPNAGSKALSVAGWATVENSFIEDTEGAVFQAPQGHVMVGGVCTSASKVTSLDLGSVYQTGPTGFGERLITDGDIEVPRVTWPASVKPGECLGAVLSDAILRKRAPPPQR